MIENSQDKLQVGLKSSLRALKENKVTKLLIASDAEQHVTRSLLALANERHVDIVYIDSMKALGTLCQIDVGAAAAVIIK